MILAAEEGHEAVAALLIEKGLSVDAANDKGDTALIYAADRGHEAVAALLIQKGLRAELSSSWQ